MDDIIEIAGGYAAQGVFNRKPTMGQEYELVRHYIDHRKSMFQPTSHNRLAVFVEPKVGNCYPDIVFVEFDPLVYDGWSTARDNLTATDLKILYHIFTRGALLGQDIVRELRTTWKDTMLATERLLDARLLRRTHRGWEIYHENFCGVTRIEAVEAKLSAFTTVIQQALVNTSFASESYVLGLSEVSTQKLSQLSQFGLGLHVQSCNGFHTVREAKKSPLPVNPSSLHFNEWIGRILNTVPERVS